MKFQWLLHVGACLVLLAGCGGGGGGGGGGSPPPDDPPQPPAMVAGLRCSGAGSTGWCWQAPQPWGHRVRDVHFVSAELGFGVGEGGLVLRTHDGGLSWGERFLPGLPTLAAVRFADARTGWALDRDAGRVWRSDDGGDSWAVVSQLPFDQPARLDLIGSQTLVATGALSTASPYSLGTALSDDGGRSWRASPRAVQAVERSGVLWATDDTLGVLQSLDGGRSFEPTRGLDPRWSPAWWAILEPGVLWALPASPGDGDLQLQQLRWRSGPDAAWASVPAAPIANAPLLEVSLSTRGGWALLQGLSSPIDNQWWRWDGPGNDWKPYALPDGLTAIAITAMGFPDADSWWFQAFAGGPRPVYLTVDGGRTWRADIGQPAGTSDRVRFLRPDGGGGLLMAYGGFDSQFVSQPVERWYRSADGGRQWRPVPGGLPADDPVSGVHLFDDARGLAVTAGGVLLDTQDGGRQWQRRSAGLQGAQALQFPPGGSGWLVDGGRIQGSADGGRSWAPLPVPPALDGTVERLQWLDERYGFATIRYRCSRHNCVWQLHATADGGATWAERPDPEGHAGHVHLLDANRGVRFAYDKVYRTEDGGRSWLPAVIDGGVPLLPQRVVMLPAGTLLAMSTDRLLRSDDGGRRWRDVPLPLQAAVDRGFITITSSLRDIAFADDRNGWIVGHDGVVLASTDGGLTWARQASGSQQHLAVVAARPGGRVWAAGAYGSILASATGGR